MKNDDGRLFFQLIGLWLRFRWLALGTCGFVLGWCVAELTKALSQ